MSNASAPHAGEETKSAAARAGAELTEVAAESEALTPLLDDAAQLQSRWRNRARRALPLLALIGLGIGLWASGWHRELDLARIAEQQRTISEFVRASPLASWFALTAAIAITVASGFPGGVVLVVAGGIFLGVLPTTIIACIGNTLGATPLYLAARRMMDAPGSRPPALVARLRAGFERHPVSFTYFVRIAPVFPYGPASIALAWLGCRLPLFLSATALGSIPSTLIYAGLGSGLVHAVTAHQRISSAMLTEARVITPLLLLALLTLLPIAPGLLRRLTRRNLS
jgi:uncharacterized membrane protein YdjX (TVP38/TMEM64 family)